MKNLFSLIRNFIFPSYCLYCRTFIKAQEFLCIDCLTCIRPVTMTTFTIDGVTVPVYAASYYQEPLKTLVIAKKRFDYRAAQGLGHLMWHYTPLKLLDFDFLVSVPLHWTRYAYRGYNQIDVLAQHISMLSGKPVLFCLKRVKRTRAQSYVSVTERRANVEQAFRRNRHATVYKDKVVVLVDDLITTGATLEAAARELLKGEPKQLYIVVACKVV